MKNSLLVLAISLLGLNLISCKNGDSKKVEELQAKLDSIALADSLKQVEEKQKELVKAEWDEFITSDLNTFNLKGHVKTVLYLYSDGSGYSKKLNFSKDGNLEQATNESDTEYIISRNKKGQITALTDDWNRGVDESFEYDDSGYLCYICYSSGATAEYYYTATNDNKWPTRGFFVFDGSSGGSRVPISLSYPVIDDHGNWTSSKSIIRNSKVSEDEEDTEEVEIRTITYYSFQ